MRAPRRALFGLVALAAVAVGACGGGGDGDSGDGPRGERPTTPARIQIVEPAANEVTGPDTTLRLNLLGARVVDRTSGPLRPDEGHIHVTLDGKLISMSDGTTQDLKGLSPGPHTVQAEFVATDHAPFSNRVVAAAVFTVQ